MIYTVLWTPKPHSYHYGPDVRGSQGSRHIEAMNVAPVIPAAAVPEAAAELEPVATEAAPAEWLGQRWWSQSLSCPGFAYRLNPKPSISAKRHEGSTTKNLPISFLPFFKPKALNPQPAPVGCSGVRIPLPRWK